MSASETVPFDTRTVPEPMDTVAPDGSEIRLLVKCRRGSMVHCRLSAGAVSRATTHRSVDEMWYFLSGQGQVWREQEGREEMVEVHLGVSLSIPTGTVFQFRNTGAEPLCFICVTMPPGPGEDEALPRTGPWLPVV